MASEMLASPLSSVIASCCGIFPQRYVTFIREQGLAMLRLTTDPLSGSSLASHTLNSHFLDTWAIRLCTNTTDIPEDSQQLRTDQAGSGSVSACVWVCACGEKREIMVWVWHHSWQKRYSLLMWKWNVASRSVHHGEDRAGSILSGVTRAINKSLESLSAWKEQAWTVYHPESALASLGPKTKFWSAM